MSVRLHVGEPHKACQKHVWVVFDNKIKKKKKLEMIFCIKTIFRGFFDVVTLYT